MIEIVGIIAIVIIVKVVLDRKNSKDDGGDQ